MEIRNIKRNVTKFICIQVCMFLLCFHSAIAQEPVKIYTIKNGRMYIELGKSLKEPVLDSFIMQFNLEDLALKQFLRNDFKDSLKNQDWRIDRNDNNAIIISKELRSTSNRMDPLELIRLAQKDPHFSAMFPSVSSSLKYGYNRFKNKFSFSVNDSAVRFYLRGYSRASKVILAGSFNDWQPDALPMIRTDSGWIVDIKLGPGKYWYKFIIDGRWIIDEDNLRNENDGLGNTNSIYFKTNNVFSLWGFINAKKVYLSGSFNNWNPKELLMVRSGEAWVLPVYLAEGTHTYRFVADGKWYSDPANPLRLPNEFNDFNSVIQTGKGHLFTLKGYTGADRVFLSGSFNGWRKNELIMHRTDSGWQLPYALGDGNYEYKYIVDGKEIPDPGAMTSHGNKANGENSYLIINPNHNFRLRGFGNAKAIFLAGDFNDFNPRLFAMKKEGNEWTFQVHLSEGKHLYKYVVDGNWIIDPGNSLWEQNEYDTGNSIIWKEK